MKFKIIFILLTFTGILAGCSSRQKQELDLIQVRKFIESQNLKWFDAISQYDTTTLLTIYTDDATLMPPNFPMLKTKRQIKSYYERMIIRKVRITKGKMNIIELTGKDSTVYEIGQYIMDIERPTTPVISDTGKYSTVWKLQPDGTWKIYADCWNSNAPMRLIPQNNK